MRRWTTLVTVSLSLITGSAWAASPPPAPAAQPAPAAAPATAEAEETPGEIADTDHEANRLRLGVGYFGRFDVPLGNPGSRAAGEMQPTHQVGVRYWFRRRLAFEAAVGGSVQSGSPKTLVWSVRIALPIAALVEKHLTLFVAPTAAYGQGTETVRGEKAVSPITGLEFTPPDAQHTGLRLSIGGRVGAELHLGFLGMQRLSFIGAVGLDANYVRGASNAAGPPTTKDPEPKAVDTKASRVSLRTTFSDDPWASFLGNVAIVGYF